MIRLARASAVTPALADRYRALLTAAELARVERLPRSHRPAGLLARVLPRVELAARLECDAGAIAFDIGPHGKPEVSGVRRLPFNLSHAGDWVVLALGTGAAAALGVDVEVTAPDRNVLRLARRYFTPAECATLEGCADGGERERRFRELWTLKEATVKARGAALAPRLGETAFSVDRAGGRIAARTTGEAPGALWLCEPAAGVTLALCALGAGPRVAPACFRGLPLAGWEPWGELSGVAAGP